jgi:hypothetical protein
MIAQDQRSTLAKDVYETLFLASGLPSPSSAVAVEAGPHVALLTPYAGGNFAFSKERNPLHTGGS